MNNRFVMMSLFFIWTTILILYFVLNARDIICYAVYVLSYVTGLLAGAYMFDRYITPYMDRVNGKEVSQTIFHLQIILHDHKQSRIVFVEFYS